MGKFQHTSLQYLSDASLSSEAKILGIEETDFGPAVILDKTIFYPQGGGQPCDHGVIRFASEAINVISVRFDEGIVYHFIEQAVELPIGEIVELLVNKERRELNSRIHTAGHLIDTAMINCGYDYHPTKGYHFPDSP
ncbi:MAG: hypothetical protein JKY52_14585, partial [Flavobacteriales bacterium]|nr:hypothetical protein [Flavobacteriales bacterium]